MQERDFFRDRLTHLEILQIIGERRASDIFSWKSPSLKAMNLRTESLDEDQIVKLMLEEPRLIRRPLVKVGQDLVVGGVQRELEAILK